MEKEARVPIEVKIKKACEIMHVMGFKEDFIEFNRERLDCYISMNLIKFHSIIMDKIVELESSYNNNFVYLVVPGVGEFERTATILYIPDFEEDFEYLFTDFGDGTYRVFAYVINFNNIEYSESGSVLLTWSYDNKLVRVG